MSETIVRQETHNLPDPLCRERDRFVAFAFSSADIPKETDPQGANMFAAGSTEALLRTGLGGLVGHPPFNTCDFEAPRERGPNRNLSGVD
jgi:hypothetical protein